MEAQMAELAKTFTDSNEKAAAMNAVLESMAGDSKELIKLTKKYQDQIKEQQKLMERNNEDMGRQLLDEFMGNIRNLPGGNQQMSMAQQQDLERIAGVDKALGGVVPMF